MSSTLVLFSSVVSIQLNVTSINNICYLVQTDSNNSYFIFNN